MATVAHCIYCFECLSASLDGRTPMKLAEVEESWELFTAPRKVAEVGEGEDEDDDEEDEEEGEEQEGGGPVTRSVLKNKNLDRLKPRSTPSSSASSSASTPSTSSSGVASSSASSITSFSSLFSGHSNPEPSYPLFVTWNTISRRGHKSLRGCIGTFDPQPLSEGLRSYALTSAFSDTRFSPINSRERPSLSCSLTLLLNFTPCNDPFDWEIGKHGIRISFHWRGQKYGATYLPDVCSEQGWTKEECLTSLMRKAGWSDGTRHGKGWETVTNFKTIRYEGMKASCDYPDWKDWRDWVESEGRGV
ncbi:MAG: hypothetical protein M1834_001283 [Cirrosporium novae-zelandiae]|nr:MAG: hypothetical protein M1834_001283 [Cirrosporium novae-zelandiae]